MSKLKESLRTTVVDYDRKLAELSYECNRRITAMNAEYDKLANLVHQALTQGHVIAQTQGNAGSAAVLPGGAAVGTAVLQPTNGASPLPAVQTANQSGVASFSATPQPTLVSSSLPQLTSITMPTSGTAGTSLQMPENTNCLLHSLSQAAHTLQSGGQVDSGKGTNNGKRPAPVGDKESQGVARAKLS